MLSIQELLSLAKERNATDLHLTADMPPIVRESGILKPLLNQEALPGWEVKELFESVITARQKEVFLEKMSVDLAISVSGIGRFRVHGYFQKGKVAAVFRRLADGIPEVGGLGLPEVVKQFTELRDGLVLVTGATGSGKSTTLAALIDLINLTQSRNIITIEDPIEYVHLHKNCVINQRELHTDVSSFADALRSALRADPDIILVGEIRDLETIRTTLMAAETGHLVFSTLHSRDAVSSLHRMIGVFPPEEQQQIRQQLSISLRGVISQQLLPRTESKGLVLASEVMVVTPAISNLVRMNKHEHIYMALEMGHSVGMHSMEQCLVQLLEKKFINMETALRASKSAGALEERLKGRKLSANLR